jgi:hypothetical protein
MKKIASYILTSITTLSILSGCSKNNAITTEVSGILVEVSERPDRFCEQAILTISTLDGGPQVFIKIQDMDDRKRMSILGHIGHNVQISITKNSLAVGCDKTAALNITTQ